MKYEEALKKIEGADSVGGQLIVVRDGKHILVGKAVQGTLIIEDTDEARAVMVEVGVVEVEEEAPLEPAPPEPTTHEVKLDDAVETKDKLKK
jgi:hypothetical protein